MNDLTYPDDVRNRWDDELADDLALHLLIELLVRMDQRADHASVSPHNEAILRARLSSEPPMTIDVHP